MDLPPTNWTLNSRCEVEKNESNAVLNVVILHFHSTNTDFIEVYEIVLLYAFYTQHIILETFLLVLHIGIRHISLILPGLLSTIWEGSGTSISKD